MAPVAKFILFAMFLVCYCDQTDLNIKLGILLPAKGDYPFIKPKAFPAIEIAVDQVKERQLLPNCNISINYRDSKCSDVFAPLGAMDLFTHDLAHIFIGPVCVYAVAPVARFSPYWDIPVITPGAPAKGFQDKKSEYKLLTRIQGPFMKNAEFLIEVLRTFNWSKLGMIFHENLINSSTNSDHFFVVQPVFDIMKNTMVQPWYERFDENFKSRYDFGKILMEASMHARIVVLCASADSVRDIMIKAHELNFDNGEYVFLNIDLFSSKNESTRPWYRENDTKERNDKARKAYEALMTVTLRKPTSPKYKDFSEKVKERAKENDANFTYGEEEVNSFVGAFHDAVILYALALNETLANNKSITNGTEITKRMWNRTFEGITGIVSIDDNGDRNADYSLLDMNPITGDFEVVANYFGKDKEYKPTKHRQIHWAGGRKTAPPDTPKCGFDGAKCPPDKPFPEYGIVIIVLGSLLVIVLVAAFFIYRHIKLEAELAEMNWRVKWEDIMFGSMENDKKMRRQGSNLSLTRTNNGEACAEGRVLIERSEKLDQDWCKCGQCEDMDRLKRVCCRQLELFGIFHEGGTCITSSKDFQDVVLNKQVLLAVYIHVMLVRRQRGAAPIDLSPCKLRLMSTRQFLCWMHRGQKLKKESRMVLPSCVCRAIRLRYPDEGEEQVSRGSVTTTSLCEMMPLDSKV